MSDLIALSPLAAFPQIVIAIELVSDKPAYHWYFFVPTQGSIHEGTKIHATQLDPYHPESWTFEVIPGYSLNTTRFVAAACVIGLMPDGKSTEDLIDIVSAIPIGVVPEVDVGREPNFTCRVWIKEAVRRLHSARFVECPDVESLEREVYGFGREALDEVERIRVIVSHDDYDGPQIPFVAKLSRAESSRVAKILAPH